ncbi:hypothetical protein Tco_1273205 [Tanacetum coccineum]
METMDWPKMIREQTVEFIESQEIDRNIEESVKEVVISSVKHAMRALLRARFNDRPTSDMKEILLQRMLEENYDKGHANHRVAYEALQDSIRRDEVEDFDVDKAQEETKKKSKQDSWNGYSKRKPKTNKAEHGMEKTKSNQIKQARMADTQAEIILRSRSSPRHIFNILNQTSTAQEIWNNVELLMQGSRRTLQQQKEDLFDEYERFRAIGNESIHDYFVRFHKLVNDMKITQLEIPTHQMNTNLSTISCLLAYEPHAKKTLKKQEQSTSIVDPLAYSPNDAMMATDDSIANTHKVFPKAVSTTNKTSRTSSNSRTTCYGAVRSHCLLKPFQGKGCQVMLVNTGTTAKKVICYNCRGEGHVARQYAESFYADVEIPHFMINLRQLTTTNSFKPTSRMHVTQTRNWLSANEIELIKLVKSGPKAPATPYVHKSLPPSQVLASRQKFKAVFHQFEEKISALLLTFDIVEAPSSNCLGEDLRSACLDGLKVENVSLKRRYDELSKANTHSRTAYTENTKLKAQVTGTTSSGPSTSETPKVLAPGMYNVGSKYIPPPKRANWDKPTPLPKKKQDKTPLLELAKLWPKRALGINSSLRLRVRIQERHSRDLWHSNCSIVSDSGCSNIMTDMVDLLKGSRTTNLYSISLNDMMSASPVCLLTKASSTKSVDDFTRFGWVRFLRTKDETPQVIEKFIVKTQRALNATVRFVEQIMRNGLSEKTETELYGKLLVLCSSCESSHCFPMADAVATGFGEYGNVLKNKARIVGERITTEACIDFAESFAPVNQKEFVDPEHAIACVPPQDSSLWALNQSPRAGYDKLSAFSNQVRITKGKVDPTPITREAANISYWDKYMVSKTQKESTNSVSAQFLWTSACSWSKPKSRKVNGPSPQQT